MSDRPDISVPQKPGALLFMLVFLALSALLLSQLGEQTKFSSKGKLFAQPAFWPAVGVIGMVVFSALHILTRWRDGFAGTLVETLTWARALEFALWFTIYCGVFLTVEHWALQPLKYLSFLSVPMLGYLPSTLIFTVLLALRMGYRKPRTLIAAAGAGFAIVLVFKTFLSVKIPGGAVYEYLPAAIRNFLILNF